MPNIASARKRVRQNIKRRVHNSARRSEIRTYVKHIIKLCAAQQKEDALKIYRKAQPLMDRAINRKLFTKNKISNLKSRLTQRINKLNGD